MILELCVIITKYSVTVNIFTEATSFCYYRKKRLEIKTDDLFEISDINDQGHWRPNYSPLFN